MSLHKIPTKTLLVLPIFCLIETFIFVTTKYNRCLTNVFISYIPIIARYHNNYLLGMKLIDRPWRLWDNIYVMSFHYDEWIGIWSVCHFKVIGTFEYYVDLHQKLDLLIDFMFTFNFRRQRNCSVNLYKYWWYS